MTKIVEIEEVKILIFWETFKLKCQFQEVSIKFSREM